MKRKFFSIVAALALAFTLTGCVSTCGGFGHGGFNHGPGGFNHGHGGFNHGHGCHYYWR